ncbi:MAG: hypothetical protein HXY30_20650 [Pseudorhodoplanes sp.]|nr:hypothetical protein [Pseudorhodoplanes sp.]
MRIRGYAIRGLAGGPPLYFSRGMDTLADRLKALGVTCSVHAQGWLLHPYGNVGTILADALQAAQAGARIVLIGHSMGADAALKVAVRLGENKIAVPLVVCFDPTSFRALLGPPPVPPNVGCALNFYQKVDPVGRGTLRAAPGFRGRLIQERHDQAHVTLDDDPKLHARVVAEVKTLMAAAAA